jgi:hypothetical protein
MSSCLFLGIIGVGYATFINTLVDTVVEFVESVGYKAIANVCVPGPNIVPKSGFIANRSGYKSISI